MPTKPSWDAFLESLPTEFSLCDHTIRLRRRENGQVGIKVSPTAAGDPRFDSLTRGPATTTAQAIRAFLAFYLRTPAGPSVLTLDLSDLRPSKQGHVNSQRLAMVRKAFDAWRGLKASRAKNGRLRESVECIASIQVEGVTVKAISWCTNRTKDPSGLCHHHNKPGMPTLFNEGTVAWIEVLDWANRTVDVEEERARRKAQWENVAARISYTATDRQIFFLLDLGAKPRALEGIDKARASEMIDRLLSRRGKRR